MRRVDHEPGRREVRLARAEVDDRPPLGAQRLGARGHGDRRRFVQLSDVRRRSVRLVTGRPRSYTSRPRTHTCRRLPSIPMWSVEHDSASPTITRGQNAVIVMPHDWASIAQFLAPLLERIDPDVPELQLLVITSDAEVAAAVTAAARSHRRAPRFASSPRPRRRVPRASREFVRRTSSPARRRRSSISSAPRAQARRCPRDLHRVGRRAGRARRVGVARDADGRGAEGHSPHDRGVRRHSRGR